jgi:hypothetical protein
MIFDRPYPSVAIIMARTTVPSADFTYKTKVSVGLREIPPFKRYARMKQSKSFVSLQLQFEDDPSSLETAFLKPEMQITR